MQTRDLVLRFRPGPTRPRWEDGQEYATYSSALYNQSIVARDRFVDNCKFLLLRDDIMKRIRTLTVASEWTEERIRDTDWRDSFASFMTPIRRCAVKVLRSTTNITELHLQALGISAKMVASMAKMAGLRTLYLSLRFQWDAANLLPVTSVKNLLVDDFISARDMVMVTRLYPKTKTLVLQTGYDHKYR